MILNDKINAEKSKFSGLKGKLAALGGWLLNHAISGGEYALEHTEVTINKDGSASVKFKKSLD